MQIVAVGNNDKCLYEICEPIQDVKEHGELVAEMIHFIKAGGGLGLAAPQVGINKRFFVAKIGNQVRAYFNPVIERHGRDISSMPEACLSLPGRQYKIIRHRIINIKYIDEKGVERRNKLSGLDATVFQHELDHLDGVLISERVKQKAS